MKKLFAIMAASMVAASVAMANTVQWWVPYGMYDHTATDLVTEDSGAILDNHDVLWQLIYAGPNKAIDPVDIDNSAKGFVSGDDEVLGTRPLSNGSSGDFDNFLYLEDQSLTAQELSYVYSDSDPYFVYQRVYELDKGAAAPVAGNYYYESSLVQLGSDYEYGLQSLPIHDPTMENGVKPTLTIQGGGNVPEPATMSLLGLGALAMVLRRKLRK